LTVTDPSSATTPGFSEPHAATSAAPADIVRKLRRDHTCRTRLSVAGAANHCAGKFA
jgi:hypothetical protein